MSNPQEPERVDAPGGAVPSDNRLGHHPSQEQDKPDLDAFAERLGTAPPSEPDAGARPNVVSSVLASRWGVAALVAAVLVVLGVVAGRRRRSPKSH